MATDNGAIGWDDEVSASDAGDREQEDFVILPDGTYPCRIAKVERGSFKGSKKLPPCNKVKIGVIIDGGDAGRGWSDHNFYMHTSTLWKIYQFLEAVGLHKKGDTTAGRIPWEKVAKGMTCLCSIHIREYGGRDYNEVDKWFPDNSDDQPEADEEEVKPLDAEDLPY